MTLRPWLQRVRKVLGTSSRGRSRRKCHPLPCASQTEQFESRQLLSAGAVDLSSVGDEVGSVEITQVELTFRDNLQWWIDGERNLSERAAGPISIGTILLNPGYEVSSMPAVTEWPEDVDHDETGDDVIDVVSDDEAVSDLPDEMTEEPIDTGNEQATPEEEVDPIQSEDDGAGDASQQDDPTSENPVLEDESFSELPEEESEAPIDVETEGDMPADEVGSDLPEDDGMGDDQQADPASDEVVPEDESFSELPEETTEEPIDGGNEQDTPAEEVDAGLPEEEGVGDASPQDNPSFYITDFRYVDHWKNCNERLRLNKNGDDLLRPGDLFGSEIARLNSLDVVATEIRGGLTISYLEGGGRIESGKHDGVNRGVFYYNEQGEFVGGSSTLIGVFSPRAATELIEWNGAEPEVIDQEAVSHEELDEQDSLVGVPQEDTPAPNVTEESEQPAEEVATTDDEVEVPRVDNEMDADSLDPQAIDLVFSLMSELEASIP